MKASNYKTFTDAQLADELNWVLTAYKGKTPVEQNPMHIAITAEINARKAA